MSVKDKEGWLVTGIEINPTLAKFALSKGLNVINKPLEENSLPDNSFDLIVMIHVVEHIPNLNEFLGKISRLLKSGGYCFIVVPNYGSWVIRMLYRGRWSGFIPGQHIWEIA